jgi:hypothetical protein
MSLRKPWSLHCNLPACIWSRKQQDLWNLGKLPHHYTASTVQRITIWTFMNSPEDHNLNLHEQSRGSQFESSWTIQRITIWTFMNSPEDHNLNLHEQSRGSQFQSSWTVQRITIWIFMNNPEDHNLNLHEQSRGSQFQSSWLWRHQSSFEMYLPMGSSIDSV